MADLHDHMQAHIEQQVDRWVCELSDLVSAIDNLLPSNPRRMNLEDRRDELGRKIDAALGTSHVLAAIDEDPFAIPILIPDRLNRAAA